MDFVQALRVSKSGLAANRTKMNVIAENLANAETTRTAEGGPYRRQMVVFAPKEIPSFENELEQAQKPAQGVEVGEVIRSQEDFRLVYNPSHPDADPVTGYVAMPNVSHLTEMADMMVARRAYEANVAALTNTRGMLLKALEIGK